MTEDEARELITRLLGTSNPILLHPFEFGWAAQERLPDRERAMGMSLGQGVFIIDHEGVITAHRSLPPILIVEEYIEARREGRITGLQVWPKPASNQEPSSPNPGPATPPVR